MTVLVLRALGIGDLATAVPALRGIRAAYPDDEIALAAPAWLGGLVTATGAVDRLVPVAGLDAGPIPEPAPRVAVNLHGRGPQSHRLLAGTRPGRMLAFALPRDVPSPAGGASPGGPAWRAAEHEVRRWCRMLAWYGIAADPTDLRLGVPDGAPLVSGACVVHPGAKDPARWWPARRFAAVARHLATAGHDVVVTGSPAERGRCLRVADLAGLAGDRVLAGRTDVGTLAGVVAAARLVISGDTGVAHLATGYRIPSVVMFGPTPPAWWGPLIDPRLHRVLWRATTREVASIGVDEVLAAIEDLSRAVDRWNRATARASYVDPRVVEAYQEGTVAEVPGTGTPTDAAEQAVRELLRDE